MQRLKISASNALPLVSQAFQLSGIPSVATSLMNYD